MITIVRMPDALADRARQQAALAGISLNDFIVTAVVGLLEEQKEAEWRAGFEEMAQDAASTDIEYAFAAQAETIRG